MSGIGQPCAPCSVMGLQAEDPQGGAAGKDRPSPGRGRGVAGHAVMYEEQDILLRTIKVRFVHPIQRILFVVPIQLLIMRALLHLFCGALTA